MNFQSLVASIHNTNRYLQQQSIKAVNIHITLRNWLVGFYIVEFEQKGEDRASYGSQLLHNLAAILQIKGLTAPELSRCRQFYHTYPQLSLLLPTRISNVFSIRPESPIFDSELDFIKNEIFGLSTQKSTNIMKEREIGYIKEIFRSISYTHFTELIKIEDEIKRQFYELLVLKTQVSVKELKRQIATLTYERLGFSENKEKAFEVVKNKITPQNREDLVKSHYFFEFLNISQPHLIEETELEQALIEHLQMFMLELGIGFCFESRQKRILIGDEYYFIDLVFYHRILKCHVLIELKTEKAKHEHIGQLKTYLNYYKKNFQDSNDNPPVGILLVTDQNKALVEYAIADTDKDIFVSKYILQLPNKEKLESFVTNELKKLVL
ncbi:PDDEXK nuclease domain-containing protein [Flectobacillus longus]|uniref:PDDEXK nuclease domain-containing protein n=1 Tax=Flectobacillus longus TaxID=2984207 RepID=UPI0024B87227|nr:PDDEXK nuclease domain-containing protein [Flectobacillus longus]MDI9880716.1 PDDEXK nuclease domain-containing protein [Flectobacillus longus]